MHIFNIHVKCLYITNFMGHNLAIIVVQNLLFIGSYGIDTNVIHLLVLFEHWCRLHCLNTNIMCLFVLFKYKCCMSICFVYTKKLCTLFSCLNNAWHTCLNNMNLWNNKFCTDFEQTHEAYKFVIFIQQWKSIISFPFNKMYLTTLMFKF
jgi:hypothetical protein